MADHNGGVAVDDLDLVASASPRIDGRADGVAAEGHADESQVERPCARTAHPNASSSNPNAGPVTCVPCATSPGSPSDCDVCRLAVEVAAARVTANEVVADVRVRTCSCGHCRIRVCSIVRRRPVRRARPDVAAGSAGMGEVEASTVGPEGGISSRRSRSCGRAARNARVTSRWCEGHRRVDPAVAAQRLAGLEHRDVTQPAERQDREVGGDQGIPAPRPGAAGAPRPAPSQ